jgi:hypothetical protein
MNRAFYRVWGKYFGYPECCIQEMVSFCNRNPNKFYGQFISQTEDGRKFRGTGFIPCKKCNKKSLKELESTINRNRICLKKFPEEENIKVSLNFIEKSSKFSKVEKKLIMNIYSKQ